MGARLGNTSAMEGEREGAVEKFTRGKYTQYHSNGPVECYATIQ